MHERVNRRTCVIYFGLNTGYFLDNFRNYYALELYSILGPQNLVNSILHTAYDIDLHINLTPDVYIFVFASKH